MAQKYSALFDKYRDSGLINRAKDYCRWTIAALIASDPNQERSQQRAVERDFQSVGALLVNNLSSKLANLLFPTNRPFFRIVLSAELQAEAKTAGMTEVEVASQLAKTEMTSCQSVFKNSSFNQLIILLKHLMVTGNGCMYRDSESRRTLTYGIQQFSVRRDARGFVVDAIIKERTYFMSLPEIVQMELLKGQGRNRITNVDKEVDIYTRVQRQSREQRVGYSVSQEVDGVRVGEEAWYPEHICPWVFPTWNLSTGEHYGRGLVEEYAPAFAKISDLSHALALYEIEIMRVINVVAPGGGDIDEYANAETGEYIVGDPEMVKAIESGSMNKVQAITADIEAVFGQLARAFMYTANTRDGERVTAYEIRQDALEAENTLGGVYSSLAEGLQVPLSHVLILETNPGSLAAILTENMKLDILAGIPALGRSTDVQNLLSAAQELAAIAESLMQIDNRVDPHRLADLVYAGRSVDSEQFLYSDEELAEQAQAEAEAREGQQQMEQAQAMAGLQEQQELTE